MTDRAPDTDTMRKWLRDGVSYVERAETDLAEATCRRDLAAADLAEDVASARELGLTWREVATELGCSASTCRRRYAGA